MILKFFFGDGVEKKHQVGISIDQPIFDLYAAPKQTQESFFKTVFNAVINELNKKDNDYKRFMELEIDFTNKSSFFKKDENDGCFDDFKRWIAKNLADKLNTWYIEQWKQGKAK